MRIPERIGKYTVESLLGKGAAGGVVLRGYDASIQRPVALKVIEKAAIDPEHREHTLERFRVEARAVGRLTHPRIAAIYEFIEDDEHACIVMELVNGKSLQAHLREERHFDLKDAWEIVRQILDGIGYSHAQGVVHRDLKPGNVLINDDGRIKITDFGVARIDTSTLTQVGDIVGTPHYMAPEQFTGLTSTTLTDLYQVGVMTYELLTGGRPFTGNNMQLLHAVLHLAPEAPLSRNPGISAGLNAAILKSLEKDPAKRFATAREFSEALRRGFDESLGVAIPAASAASLVEKARFAAAAREAVPASEPAPGAGPPTTFTTAADARKARVLFVDDEVRILNALRALFRNQYHVFTAENGELALELVKRFGVHVVVSDQRMPNLTGVDLLRQVKELQPNAVRMLLTGYSDLAAVVGSINDGEVFRFVRKPWDNAEIQRTIGDAVAIATELATLVPRGEPPDTGALVLVVDPANELAEGLGQLLPSSRVRRVPNAAAALKALEAAEVGVIVADLAAGKDYLITMFKLLKTEHPEIVTVLVTEAADAELAIELINQAQVFRLLEKPLEAKTMRRVVKDGLNKYASLRTTPELARQHAVAAGNAGLTDWGSRMLKSIRALPRRMFSRTTT